MNPQTILYAIALLGGAALAIYTTYKQYQGNTDVQPNTAYQGRNLKNKKRRRSKSFLYNRQCDDCIICLATMEGQQISKVQCGHIFHRMCLLDWLKYKTECPICRAKVISV